MKFSYKFSNLLGSVYRHGNICFTPDGNSIISPVGNRIRIFDLKNNKSKTLPIESRYNYTSISLSPNGSILLACNEKGDTQLISMVSCTVIHKHKFQNAVQIIQFSPDGQHFAVAKENMIFVFKAPGEITGEYNPFVLERAFIAAYDDITWIDWSSDSTFLCIGARDNSTKIIAIKYLKNFRTYVLGGHTDSIIGCFFEENSLHLNTISKNGQLCIWECSLEISDILQGSTKDKEFVENQSTGKRKKLTKNEESDSEDDIEDVVEKPDLDLKSNIPNKDENEVKNEEKKKKHPFFYKKLARHYLANEAKKESKGAYVTSSNYHRKSKILIISFSSGAFFLYELPDVSMIHSLSISDYSIISSCFNVTGDWLGLASAELGQLLVWEWRSEQYIMKQQGHISEMNCISYSADGSTIATGGEDSKVKLWNVSSGLCYVTFDQHTSSVTGCEFSKSKKFLVSCSLDGTVRAFDINRYRNFRTFTSPNPMQFACVAIDHSGELVAAGGQDVFEIFLWSMKLGKLLEVISGHEAPVCSIAFSPSPISSSLISGSWDKTIKIWNCLENDSQHETVEVLSDVTCVTYKPDGEEVAVATLNGSISFFETKTGQQLTSIEGRNDLGSGVSDTDVVSAKKNLQSKYFSTLVYSTDGDCILAGGKSQFICIYHVGEGILLKKFEITINLSFDGLYEYVNRRNMTDFGNLALIEEREKLEGGKVAIRLPGVQKGDMASRNYKPEIRVFDVKFSPTGQQWAAACTEGLIIYSLDKGVVFDPFNLSLEVTPKSTRNALKKQEYLKALTMAIKLNESDLIQMVIEEIPHKEIELISASIPDQYVERVLQNISKFVQTTHHIEFYLKWSKNLLQHHGNKNNIYQHQTLLSLQDGLVKKYEGLSKICDFNKYTLRMLTSLPKPEETHINGDIDDDDDDMLLVKSTNDNDVNEFNDNYDDSSTENDSE